LLRLPVAQPGQSNGLLSRGSQVQILPGRPLFRRRRAGAKSRRAGHFIVFSPAQFPPVLRATIPALAHKSAFRPRRRGRTAIGLPSAIAGALALSLLPAVATAHGSLREQIDAVTKEIAAHPGDATLYVKRGELHRFDGQLSAALADYIEASRIDPSLPEAVLGRGRALLDAGRAARARDPLVRFLKARPDHAEGRLALARCLAKLGRQTESASEYTRAISRFTPPGPDLYVERARVLAAGGHPAEAIRGLDEGIARLGQLVALQDVAIELEVKRKNWSGALGRIDRITPSSGRQETWLARRGEILAAAGRPREARESFEAAKRSIESLPPRLRQTRAMSRLEEKVRDSLAALKEQTDAKS
jgi:hypothetical protein